MPGAVPMPPAPPRRRYLGDEVEIVDSALSPDGRHLLVVTQAKSAEEGQAGKMPKYVTESGYEEFQEVRTRVGRNDPVAHTLWLVDVTAGSARQLSFDALPGIATDPLASLRKAAKRDALKGNRTVRVESDGDGSGPAVHWSDDGRNVAVEIRATDNKDRWIASVDLDTAKLQPRHRLSDGAWISWDFNDFGWLPDNRTLWLLSEESGYSHLYTVDGNGKPRQRTRGKWEVSLPVPSTDGSGMYFLCNQKWPGDYEVCKLDLRTDQLTEVTALNGVEGFSLSPNGQQLLVRYSGAYLPPQLAVVPAMRQPGQGTHRYAHSSLQGAVVDRTAIRTDTLQAWSRHGLGQVLRPADARAGQAVSDRDVRARRRLPAERFATLYAVFPRADVPQPTGAAGLHRAGSGLSRLRRLRPRLAHRDLPQHGPPGTGRLPGRAGLAGDHQAG